MKTQTYSLGWGGVRRMDSQGGADDDSQNFILFIFVSPSPYYSAMLVEWIDQGWI